MISPGRIALLMVLSPGEEQLAVDSLNAASQAAVRGGFELAIHLIDNRPAGSRPLAMDSLAVLPVAAAPRPYFEIARTIFGGLAQIDARAFRWIVKIDPDTLVLNPGFYQDILTQGAEHKADFIACLTRGSTWNSHLRLVSRLLSDMLPIARMRRTGESRYGRASHWRLGKTWHGRILRKAMLHGRILRRYPSGGFYALGSQLLARLQAEQWLETAGANGLEWNDDTLLPLAVRAAGGRILNLRSTPVEPHWRWMHGSRYFTVEDALVPELRGVHPLKQNAEDWSIRQQLGFGQGAVSPAQSS